MAQKKIGGFVLWRSNDHATEASFLVKSGIFEDRLMRTNLQAKFGHCFKNSRVR